MPRLTHYKFKYFLNRHIEYRKKKWKFSKIFLQLFLYELDFHVTMVRISSEMWEKKKEFYV